MKFGTQVGRSRRASCRPWSRNVRLVVRAFRHFGLTALSRHRDAISPSFRDLVRRSRAGSPEAAVDLGFCDVALRDFLAHSDDDESAAPS